MRHRDQGGHAPHVRQREEQVLWALKHLFVSHTSLAGRLKLLQRVVENSILWSAGAFVPDVGAMHVINTSQTQMVVWCMGLYKRRPCEGWLEHRKRTWRLACSTIHRVFKERWSAVWLRRVELQWSQGQIQQVGQPPR